MPSWNDALASLPNPTGLEVSVTTKSREAIWAKLVMNLIGGSRTTLSTSLTRDVLNKPTIAGTAKANGR